MLKNIFQSLTEHRAKQGPRYECHHTWLFSLFAMLSHATSDRKIHSLISIHVETLKEWFDLSWKRAPAYTTIRNIITGLSPEEAEKPCAWPLSRWLLLQRMGSDSSPAMATRYARVLIAGRLNRPPNASACLLKPSPS